jgi:hypothetical protein
MDRISSSEFRKTYPKLKAATTVTAQGRVIGVWTPVEAPTRTDLYNAKVQLDQLQEFIERARKMQKSINELGAK